jgi:Mg-chelatase subunit ChlI
MKDAEKRVEVIERRLAFEENPEKFMESWQAECDLLRDKITAAKALLPLVEADRTSMMRIAVICMEAEVDGHRADIIMLKTAKTLAAWNGRKAVSDEDILEAAKFVLPHRMRRQPLQQVGRA